MASTIGLVKQHSQIAAQVGVFKKLLMNTVDENRELKVKLDSCGGYSTFHLGTI